MKYKMQVLYFSKAGNTEKIAQAIGRDQKTKSDQIPPAYPVEAQKLLFIGLELGKVDKKVLDFVTDLKPARTKNVAFFVTGDAAPLEELKDILKKNEVNVVEDVHVCPVKKGLFKQGAVSDADVKACVAWASKVVDSLA